MSTGEGWPPSPCRVRSPAQRQRAKSSSLPGSWVNRCLGNWGPAGSWGRNLEALTLAFSTWGFPLHLCEHFLNSPSLPPSCPSRSLSGKLGLGRMWSTVFGSQQLAVSALSFPAIWCILSKLPSAPPLVSRMKATLICLVLRSLGMCR